MPQAITRNERTQPWRSAPSLHGPRAMTADDLVDLADSDLDGVTGANGRCHRHHGHHWCHSHRWREGGWRERGWRNTTPAVASSFPGSSSGSWFNNIFAGLGLNFAQSFNFQSSASTTGAAPTPHFDPSGTFV